MSRPLSIDAVCDIETESWDKYVLGGRLDSARNYFETTDPVELYSDLRDRGGQVWTWNGGRYEDLWFLDLAVADELPCRVYLAGSSITRVDAGKLQLRDGARLVPMSLAKAAGLIGKKKTEPGFPCECGRECGGYCAIRRGMSSPRLRTLGEYLYNDNLLTLEILEFVVEWSADNGLILAGTVGGTAWKSAAAELGLEKAEWPNATEYEFARRGYYGGRVQVFRPRILPSERTVLDEPTPVGIGIIDGFRYDINSAYPAALATTPLPTGTRRMLDGASAFRAYLGEMEGVYQATVEVEEDDFIPPLPVRTGDRITYPVGRVDGIWTGLELRAAEETGARVTAIHSGLVWSDSEALLAPWVERIFALRAAAGPKTALGQWLKCVPNAFTGKTGQAPEVEHAVFFPDKSKIRCCNARPPCSPTLCTKKCRPWRPLDPDGKIWAVPQYRLADCAHVQYTGYLTAATRVKQLRPQLVADGQGGRTAIYCDTDSAYTTTPRTWNIGDALGQWKYEGRMCDWRALGPKAYCFVDAETGEIVVKCKGLSDLDSFGWERFLSGQSIPMNRGVKSFKSAVRGCLFERKDMSRSSKADGVRFGDRMLASDGLTHPVDTVTLADWRSAA